MSRIRAIVRNGRIETAESTSLPDGTECFASLPDQEHDGHDDWDNSPAGIAAWLEWYDSPQPLHFTEQELTTLQENRYACKVWEKSKFEAQAKQAIKVWE